MPSSARDLWDQVNVVEVVEEERDELAIDTHLREFTLEVIGENAYQNQKEIFKKTNKPDNLSVKQWINCIKNINSYLLLIRENA